MTVRIDENEHDVQNIAKYTSNHTLGMNYLRAEMDKVTNDVNVLKNVDILVIRNNIENLESDLDNLKARLTALERY